MRAKSILVCITLENKKQNLENKRNEKIVDEKSLCYNQTEKRKSKKSNMCLMIIIFSKVK